MTNPTCCFVCSRPAEISLRSDATYYVSCSRCGDYEITLSLTRSPSLQRPDLHILSGVLRQQRENNTRIALSEQNLNALIWSAQPPSDPLEAIDHLLLYLLKKTKTADLPVHIEADLDYPILFAKNAQEFMYYFFQAESLNYIEHIQRVTEVRLKIEGWKRISQLRSLRPIVGKRAFMAMQYGDPDHIGLFETYFKPAIKQTGFDLVLLRTVLKAGLIDNQLRVQIRNSRFLLADLTNGNHGAYWEAGYAEGIGIPVIYLCRKSDFASAKTHFDTNHLTTIVWDQKCMQDAMDELKATVRATLPVEATLSDEE